MVAGDEVSILGSQGTNTVFRPCLQAICETLLEDAIVISLFPFDPTGQ